jgi:hypothetical protein
MDANGKEANLSNQPSGIRTKTHQDGQNLTNPPDELRARELPTARNGIMLR